MSGLVERFAPRLWPYLGVLLGGAVSIAANVAHSFIPPQDAPLDWTPEVGAVISAIVWPLFLFIAIEILARTPWPNGWGWNLLRWVCLPPVALVAAFVSYRHLSGLLDHYNEETLVVWFGPLAVDGLMLLATAALLATRTPTGHEEPAPATLAPAEQSTTPEAVDLEPVDLPADPAPVIAPPAPVATPAAPAAVRSALISSTVQTPRNGHVFASEVIR